MVASILENSGRSASMRRAFGSRRTREEIAEALAERLARVVPRDAEDPEAQIAPFADAGVAARISDMIDSELEGARDVSAPNTRRAAGWPRTRAAPTCCRPSFIADSRSIRSPIASSCFPFASVVQVAGTEIPQALGPSLVVTAITHDRKLIDRLLASPLVGRLNLGAIPTNHIQWDQPHEGNLFDHLYARRAFQRAMRVMKILAFTAGAANMYCGSCLRDNALAAELRRKGHDVTLLPLYTPTLTDEPNVSRKRVFFGGISVYLEQHLAPFRHTPAWLDRLWDSLPALKAASRRSIAVNPRHLGELTVSMLRGEDGYQRKEIRQADAMAAQRAARPTS